jgi:hypothetical protein
VLHEPGFRRVFHVRTRPNGGTNRLFIIDRASLRLRRRLARLIEYLILSANP